MRKNWYNSNLAIILLHVTAWALFLFIPYLLQPNFQSNFRPPGGMPMPEFRYRPAMRPLFFRMDIFLIAIFYLNAYILLPLLNKRKIALFAFLQVVVLACFLFIDHAFLRQVFEGPRPFGPVNFRLVLSYIFIIAVSTSYRLILDRIQSAHALKERENEALKSELALLRSQVSPHFMFNVLNSMVSLARKKEDLEPSLIKLSSLMRYMIYSSKEDKVLLQKELEYLVSYIDLQTMRFGRSASIGFDLHNESEEDCKIEPMLLIPFIENAFKHGTNYIGDPEIKVRLHISTANRLNLHVQNRYSETTAEDANHSSGIGLTNVRKRLELLYKGNYGLKVDMNENWFIIELDLNLS